MRKDTRGAKITKREMERIATSLRKRYIVEQYFGLSHLHNGAYRARFTVMIEEHLGCDVQTDWRSTCFVDRKLLVET